MVKWWKSNNGCSGVSRRGRCGSYIPFTLIILFTFSLFHLSTLHSQPALLRKAEKKMGEFDFQGAIELLEPRVARRGAPAATALLGECYRRTGDFRAAEMWFGQVGDWAEIHPQYLLSYARTLQRAAKYTEAQGYYQRYLGLVPGDRLAQEQRDACGNIRELQKRGLGWWDVQPLPFNTPYREFCPVKYEDALVFCSDRPAEGLAKYEDAWTGEGFMDIFRAGRKTLDPELCGSFTYKDPVIFHAPLSSRFHEASAYFSPDYQTIYFTTNALGSGKSRDDSGLLRLQILYARRLPGNRGWTDPISLPINSAEYSVMHPCLSPDGRRLYFASDMPGGHGGFDLYYVEMINDVWGPPINLGPGINTRGSEVFPYLSPRSELFFSSDGWGGLGGLDIFFSHQQAGGWSAPRNPGAPLNSAADDFGFSWEDEGSCGYFSSDRDGGAGKDDLYSFRNIAHPVTVQIQDAKTGALLNASLVADCRPDTLSAPGGQAIWEIPHNACCQITALSPGYYPETFTRCSYNLSPGRPLEASLNLSVRPVYRLEGVVFDNYTGLPMDNALVQIIVKDTGQEFASFRTTFNGRFELELKGGACYQVRVTHPGQAPVLQSGPCIAPLAPSEDFRVRVYVGG
jgi:tetratricopeptide (TPR) repeat protein